MARRYLRQIAVWLPLAGCTVGPNFKPPDPAVPRGWNNAAAEDSTVTVDSNPDPAWWNTFDDPVLARLIDRAIAGNLDLQQAVLRVVESRQSIVTARAAGLPTLGGTGSYMREQLGLKGVLESKGAYSQLNQLADASSPINRIAPGTGASLSSTGTNLLNQLTSPIDLFQNGIDASWELDLFGRVRRSVEQAKARTQAQIEATNAALVMLEAEVAQAYLQLRGAQSLAASQEENIRTDQDALDVTSRRATHGLTTYLDVEQARTQLDNDQRQLPGYEKQVRQSIDQLNVLVGQPPGTLDAMLNPRGVLPTPPRVVGLGVPSTLARRRPDILQAEAQLHAATAGVGVAVANFYPDVSLTGNLGIRATDASYLTNWASQFYSFGPSISLPIFQGGRLTASLRMARAEQQSAALNYRGAVLNALREVEDALVAYRTDREQRDKLVETVAAASDTLYLSRNRYDHGLADFLRVLDAQRTLVTARQQLVQQDITLANDVVALYRALGGGWQDNDRKIQAPAAPSAPPVAPAALDSLAAHP